MSSDIVIEITGLKSLSKFIGLEDTPLYYDNGKFFKVEDNKIIYTDIEWKDISGNIEEAPEIVDLIEDFVETISGKTIQGYIEKHNSSESAHPYIQNTIQKEIFTRIEADNTLQDNIDITNNNLEKEVEDRTDGDTLLQNNINNLSNTVTNNYNTLDNKIDTEISNRTSADEELQDDIDNLSNTVTNNYTELNNKILNNTNNITANTNSITNINSKIPQQASASNKLADKNFVNSSIATNTANFIGTFNSVAELEAYSGVLTNNDYAFVATTDSVGNTLYDRYKWNGSEWLFEYELNNSSFTASQWASINSGITDTLTTQITTNQNTITNIQNNYVPNTRTVNGKALSSNITLNASDVNALANTTTINDLTTTAQQNALNSGATSAKIGQITTNTNNITTNTNDISTINEKIPSDASISNKLVTTSALQAVKGYSATGELLTDAEGLADVIKYAHSSFDSSKFTVVGSPNITDDGIASGFSSSNYLTIPVSVTNNVKIDCTFDYNNINSYQGIIHFNTSDLRIMLVDNGNIGVYCSGAGAPLAYALKTALGNPQDNAKIRVVADITTSTSSVSIYVNNVLKYSLDKDSLSLNLTSSLLYIGKFYAQYLSSPIDLKQFSITVDGVEVFSGNKTGIDTIKPDDYTIVGTPTISVDGILSNTSQTNYIKKILTNFNWGKWEIKINNVVCQTSGAIQVFYDIYGAGGNRICLRKNANGQIQLAIIINNTDTVLRLFEETDVINGVVGYDGTKYYWTINNVSDILTSANVLQQKDYTIYFGCFYDLAGGGLTNGSIDLNLLKIYVDGNLVYQPCLKVPYVFSAVRYGSKIADMQYLDRIKDAWQQNYANKYYTLDEVNGKFTLPLGELYGMIEHKLDKQDKTLHSLKGYLDNGELLTDAEGLNDVTKYAHSTFDLSKFTVVGSPVITDDGVASGFSVGNYIQLNGFTIPTDKSFEIRLETIITTEFIQSNAENRYLGTSETRTLRGALYPQFGMMAAWFWIYNTSTSASEQLTVDKTGQNDIKTANLVAGDIIEIHLGRNKEQNIYYCQYRKNKTGDFNYFYKESEYDLTPTTGNLLLGTMAPASGSCWNGLYNLKHFSITVDGVEVFSGNKTGIDTIKSDDYTVVGTPTISADGVALTGYGRTDNSNKFNSNTFNMLSNNQVFEGIVYIESVPSDYEYPSQGQSVLVYKQGNSYIRIYRSSIVNTNYVQLEQQVNGTWVGNSYNTRWALGTDFNGWVKFKLYYDTIDNCYKCDCYTYNNGIATFVKTMTCSYTGDAITGSGWSIDFVYGQYQNYGKIDLNSIKVYDNGLVYQPCLKIPYTQSKTGSKIVNAVYRDRVNDMASQFGSANYYTLDEENKNFTLPQGELYGLIGDKTLRDSYYNGVTYWELFSNRRLEQGGSCESGVEYTFPKPFADRNYVLTIPYSSKTTTSFIPSATGDFIAKGTGLL